jgi:LysR family transcriptional regulator, glycine cleavage system transcriptional activator
MARRLPALHAVRVFEAAARHGSFSRAAEELSVTQSAVSRQIQRLELELRQRLFARHGPRIELTPIGRDYHAVVREALGTLRRGTEKLFWSDAGKVFTLSLLPSVISKWFVPRVAAFERDHPGVALRLEASYQMVDFAVATDVDAAIRYGEGHWPGVVATLLLDDLVFPVCAPSVARRLKRPADLLSQRLLGDDPHWDLWDDWCKAAGLGRPTIRPDRLSEDFNVQLQAAILGRGVALGRGLLVADDVRAQRLVAPFPIFAPSRIQYYFVCPPERLTDRTVTAARDWLVRAAAETVAGLPFAHRAAGG